VASSLEPRTPADWGIRPRAGGENDKVTAGARVPPAVAKEWNDAVATVAKRKGISKGNAAALGMLVAVGALDSWLEMAEQVGRPQDDARD
jgi:hypothetical protein